MRYLPLFVVFFIAPVVFANIHDACLHQVITTCKQGTADPAVKKQCERMSEGVALLGWMSVSTICGFAADDQKADCKMRFDQYEACLAKNDIKLKNHLAANKKKRYHA